jgi:hypothetical protein
MTEQLSDADRSVLSSELEQAIQSFLNDTVNIEFNTRDDGNEKVLEIITTSAPEIGVTEQPDGDTEDNDDEDQEGNDDDSSNNNGTDTSEFFDGGANGTFFE